MWELEQFKCKKKKQEKEVAEEAAAEAEAEEGYRTEESRVSYFIFSRCFSKRGPEWR